MSREYQNWLKGLPKYVKKSHIDFLKKLSVDNVAMKHFKSMSIDEIEGFDCKGIDCLEDIYEMTLGGQGHCYGKGEILTSFLLKGCDMSGIKDYDLLWDGQELQVKALSKESEQISLGISGTPSASSGPPR